MQRALPQRNHTHDGTFLSSSLNAAGTLLLRRNNSAMMALPRDARRSRFCPHTFSGPKNEPSLELIEPLTDGERAAAGKDRRLQISA